MGSPFAEPAAMTLALADRPLARELAFVLRQRASELRAWLRAAAAVAESPPELGDFKDVAAEETRAVVDGAALSLAAGELAQVVAALRRVDDGSYGECQDCGEPIDGRRLRALPATPFCTACQALQERRAARH
jgi:DnaK suppressor protein